MAKILELSAGSFEKMKESESEGRFDEVYQEILIIQADASVSG